MSVLAVDWQCSSGSSAGLRWQQTGSTDKQLSWEYKSSSMADLIDFKLTVTQLIHFSEIGSPPQYSTQLCMSSCVGKEISSCTATVFFMKYSSVSQIFLIAYRHQIFNFDGCMKIEVTSGELSFYVP